MLNKNLAIAIILNIIFIFASCEKFSKEEIVYTLREMNGLRSSIKTSNMQKLIWSDKLALLAAKEQQGECYKNEHFTFMKGSNSLSMINYLISLKQNYNTEEAIDSALKNWFNSNQYYNYETNTCVGTCSPYTRLMTATASEVGCDYRKICNGNENGMLTCYFKNGRNDLSEKPYNEGENCSDCPTGTQCEKNQEYLYELCAIQNGN